MITAGQARHEAQHRYCPHCGSGSIKFTHKRSNTGDCQVCRYRGHVSTFLFERPIIPAVKKAPIPDGPYRMATKRTKEWRELYRDPFSHM